MPLKSLSLHLVDIQYLISCISLLIRIHNYMALFLCDSSLVLLVGGVRLLAFLPCMQNPRRTIVSLHLTSLSASPSTQHNFSNHLLYRPTSPASKADNRLTAAFTTLFLYRYIDSRVPFLVSAVQQSPSLISDNIALQIEAR